MLPRPAYPDEGTRRSILSLTQMLWDRGETNGWAHRVTSSRRENTPKHNVLLHMAVGDHQVANVPPTSRRARSALRLPAGGGGGALLRQDAAVRDPDDR